MDYFLEYLIREKERQLQVMDRLRQPQAASSIRGTKIRIRRKSSVVELKGMFFALKGRIKK